jgi:hypothetical protein
MEDGYTLILTGCSFHKFSGKYDYNTVHGYTIAWS